MTKRQIEVQKIIKKHMKEMEQEIENTTGAYFSEFIREIKAVIEQRCDAHILHEKFYTE